jgi:hypothetical protein
VQKQIEKKEKKKKRKKGEKFPPAKATKRTLEGKN